MERFSILKYLLVSLHTQSMFIFGIKRVIFYFVIYDNTCLIKRTHLQCFHTWDVLLEFNLSTWNYVPDMKCHIVHYQTHYYHFHIKKSDCTLTSALSGECVSWITETIKNRASHLLSSYAIFSCIIAYMAGIFWFFKRPR